MTKSIYPITWDPAIWGDLQRIYDYYEHKASLATARKVVDGLFEAAKPWRKARKFSHWKNHCFFVQKNSASSKSGVTKSSFSLLAKKY